MNNKIAGRFQIAQVLCLLALFAAGRRQLWAADAPGAMLPIDLTAQYTTSASALTNNDGFPAWKSCPLGHQAFHGVTFEIGGLMYLWGKGNATNDISGFPERISDIALNRKFATLYLCHGSYYKTPDQTPVVKVVFHYEDNSAATNALCFGADLLDWMVSSNESPLRTPFANNSMLAWTGGVFSPTKDNRLRYCMTAMENPHPDRSVATLELISCKTRTIPFILAMTTGPAGQMK